MRFDSGFYMLPRAWWTHLEFAPAAWAKVWLYLALNVNIRPAYFNGRLIQPNQIALSVASLAKACGVTEEQARAALRAIQKTNCGTIETTNKFSVVTLFGSTDYEDSEWEKPQAVSQARSQAEPKQEPKQTLNQRPTETPNGNFGQSTENKDMFRHHDDVAPQTRPQATEQAKLKREPNDLNNREYRVEKEEDALARASSPPPPRRDHSIEAKVREVFLEVARVWPSMAVGNPHFATSSWVRVARSYPDGPEAWLAKIRDVGPIHAAAYRQIFHLTGRSKAPSLQNWATDGYWQLPPPGDPVEEPETPSQAPQSATAVDPAASRPAPATNLPAIESGSFYSLKDIGGCMKCAGEKKILRDLTMEEALAGRLEYIPCPLCAAEQPQSEVETASEC